MLLPWAAAMGASSPVITVVRFPENPIIRPGMIPEDPVVNINGPSLILVPAWLPHRLGKYYLYFANHRGPDIHLAYADRLEGPWTIQRPGPLSLSQVAAVDHETPDVHGHIASPDIYVDNDHRQIRMYFHFRLPKLGHVSSVAVSDDGLHFTVQPGTIGEPYLRHFRSQGWFYFIDRFGRLLRSRDGLTDFETGPDNIRTATLDPATQADVRHTAVRLRGDTLQIFLSRVGDTPESILFSTMRLTGDWKTWRPTSPILVLAPTTAYEGADLPLEASEKGDAKGRQRQVRDPGIYEENGRVYLLYSVAGEQGIAIAELKGLP
jgi:hypothetical protein